MDRNAIERLAIDSAAGQLNEDAEALLKEYLAEHSEANKWFLDIRDIYGKTQAAFDVKTAFTKQSTGKKPFLKLNWLPVARWAAVVIFAAFIGVTAGRWSKSPTLEPNPQRTITSQGPATEQPSFDLESIGESFWREKAVAMLTSPSSRIQKDYVTGPKLWEKYRQFIKEKNYE